MNAPILVVDDDPDIREAVAEILEAEGYDVHVAVNGQDALAKLESFQPCVVLLDLMMPVMDGRELLERLGPIPLRKRITIVSADSQAERAAKQYGVHGVIRKPFELSELLHIIEEGCADGCPV